MIRPQKLFILVSEDKNKKSRIICLCFNLYGRQRSEKKGKTASFPCSLSLVGVSALQLAFCLGRGGKVAFARFHISLKTTLNIISLVAE